MDNFSAFLSFMAFVLLLKQILIVDGISDTTKDDGFMGILGAIVDNSSRIGKEESVAMQIAVEDFLNKSNRRLDLKIRNSQGDPLQAALAARSLINTDQVQAILGPQTWEEVSLVAEIGSKSRIPIMSLADATPVWATELCTFLVQASPNKLKQMEAIAAIVQRWEWHQVTIIYEDKDFSAPAVLSHLSDALQEVGAEISHYFAIQPFASSSLSEELQRLKGSQFRVFVVHLSLPVAVELFEKAKIMNMMEKDYVWIIMDPFASLIHSFNASTISSMQGIVGVKSYLPENESRFQDFRYKFRQRFSSEHPEEVNHEPSIFAAQAYDLTWTVTLAMSKKKQGRQQIISNILQSDVDGLSGKINFTGQTIAPAHTFQIINVIGESYIELGFWSDGRGFSETIAGSDAFKSSMNALGQVFWPGGIQGTPKGWSPPTIANPLKIGVPTTATFKQYVEVEVEQDHLGNNIFSYKGLAIDVFKATRQELPFHLPYNFLPFDGTFDALVEQIHLKNFDAAVGSISILANRYQHAEFTAPYTESGLVMIVPVRSRTREKAWLFIKPFTNAMWVLIGATSIYNGFVIWLIERNHCPELKGSISNQVGTLIWLAFSTLFSMNGNKLNSNLSRITMVVWLFMALVITQTYTAKLTSLLTLPQLEPTVVDVFALQNSNAMVGCAGASYISKYLEKVLHFRHNNIKNFSRGDEYAPALRTREVAALFLDLPLAKVFLAENCKSFTMTGPTYKVGGFGFAFPRGSQLLPSVTQAMLKVSENGTFQHLEQNMLASQKCMDTDLEDERLSLRLSPSYFWVLFVFTGGTSSMALAIYIFCAYNSMSMSEHNVIWKLMMAVMKHWGNQRGRFSRKVSDIAQTTPTNSPNATEY
ncbi:glutamate receptor 2.8-like [Prunus avium]|uniref:Glutamate receptor n=1 Tax=Prunus avium TaxID=42229 RepID=A0A6P5RS98_PRUAV|nr:glutamate receptor 2.8-like [Prunus avium]